MGSSILADSAAKNRYLRFCIGHSIRAQAVVVLEVFAFSAICACTNSQE
jgi:hypothetical protein